MIVYYLTTAVFKVWNATEHHQFILGPPGNCTNKQLCIHRNFQVGLNFRTDFAVSLLSTRFFILEKCIQLDDQ